jgi:hypothetical protein
VTANRIERGRLIGRFWQRLAQIEP